MLGLRRHYLVAAASLSAVMVSGALCRAVGGGEMSEIRWCGVAVLGPGAFASSNQNYCWCTAGPLEDCRTVGYF
ncbi:hypothetical protein E2C01_011661 [Portunus trituberculatus]|uniref:Uncharacterized protein n=1 Tax=Portunus trituberculatus TaxID=210409 RepID=A0A5B7DBQ7_PORTR|nr:hypothetical protein [Portunus trituberculatus]